MSWLLNSIIISGAFIGTVILSGWLAHDCERTLSQRKYKRLIKECVRREKELEHLEEEIDQLKN